MPDKLCGLRHGRHLPSGKVKKRKFRERAKKRPLFVFPDIVFPENSCFNWYCENSIFRRTCLPAGRAQRIIKISRMENYFIYAIKSLRDGRIYVGVSDNPERRLNEHNKGSTRSTRYYRPWKLIYKKFVGFRVEAREEEKRLKSGFGKEFLKSLTT